MKHNRHTKETSFFICKFSINKNSHLVKDSYTCVNTCTHQLGFKASFSFSDVGKVGSIVGGSSSSFFIFLFLYSFHSLSTRSVATRSVEFLAMTRMTKTPSSLRYSSANFWHSFLSKPVCSSLLIFRYFLM